MIEVDIRSSKDNIPVLSHDKSLKRMAKKKVLIKNKDFKYLKFVLKNK